MFIKNKCIILIIFFIILFSFYNAKTFAQTCTITNTKENIFYVGVLNPIIALVEGYTCGDIELRVSQGEIIPKNNCEYDFKIFKIGKIQIEFYNKKNKKLLGKVDYRVKNIPDPIISIGDKKVGVVNKNILLVQNGLNIYIDGFDFDARFHISSFNVIMIRKKELLYEEKTKSPYFTNETKERFKSLITGDKILFEDIVVTGPDSKIRKLASVEFLVINE